MLRSSRNVVIAGAIAALTLLVFYTQSPSWTIAQTKAPSNWRSKVTSTGSKLYDDINNRTLGFQKIFAVHLPSRFDLRDAMSLAGHFTELDIEYVDGVTEWDEKGLPPRPPEKEMRKGEIGAWRAHMNIIRMMVEQNISSALIMEDDIDWDVRIKSQLQDFAAASRYLLQPRSGSKNTHNDPTNPRKSPNDQPQDLYIEGSVVEPTSSPYGDLENWDALWLGHCGMKMPHSENEGVPLGRLVLPNDETVPEPQHLVFEWGDSEIRDKYKPHTRVVHTPYKGTCSLAYALSLPAARRMLYEFGVKMFDHAFDMDLRHMCQGSEGRRLRTCLTVQPALFEHHRPAGQTSKQSTIQDVDGWNDHAFTPNIRLSTMLNLPKLIEGDVDLLDQLPDGEQKPPWVQG